MILSKLIIDPKEGNFKLFRHGLKNRDKPLQQGLLEVLEIFFERRGGYRNGKPEHDGRGQQQKVGIDR